ncbi:MAG: CDP-6-deoxy-L-threo-D-glycero-4-hexulose-3-dehydrase reductase [Pseudomonadota bacterium]
MSFTIEVQPSGRRFVVEEGETVLAAGIRQGVGLPYGCKDGACGSCKCRKVSGEVVHGPHQEKALSAQELAAGLVLACCARPTSDVVLESRQVSAEGGLPVKKLPVRVSQLARASHDVMVVRLQVPATDPLRYRAGQYIDILLRDGARRSYSMANAPHTLAAQPQIELHIRHLPGGKFTDQVFTTLKEKDILRAEGPFGSFYLREDSDKPMVLLASGTGFAPIKALIEHMQHQGIARPATLYWGGRRPADLYMDSWVRERQAELPWLRYVPVISDALPEDGWQGRTGFVHRAVLEDLADLSGHEVYACGAPIVVDSARRDYAQAGLPDEAFFADSFTSEADKAQA